PPIRRGRGHDRDPPAPRPLRTLCLTRPPRRAQRRAGVRDHALHRLPLPTMRDRRARGPHMELIETIDARHFWRRVDRTATCWLYRGSRTTGRYGNPRLPGPPFDYAHPRAYLLAVGDIPSVGVFDH